jgi:thiol-disulfide isomerase/thioredoxin
MDDEMMDEGMDDDTMDDEMMDEGMDDEAMDSMAMELPIWQTLALTDATTGESFMLSDFQGKTVFVEPMATWCSNCRSQQNQVQQAKTQLGDDVVFVGLSLETTLPDADLASYAQDNGFDWTYAVMSEDLLKSLADEFGRSITSAPSTPHFIISPDGSVSDLSTGIHSADEIIAQIEEAQS